MFIVFNSQLDANFGEVSYATMSSNFMEIDFMQHNLKAAVNTQNLDQY